MKINEFNVLPDFPEELRPLEDMAYNLWWCWNHDARELFKTINPDAWEKSKHNPMTVLGSLTRDDYEKLKQDPVFMSRLEEQYRLFQEYMSLPKWFEQKYKEHKDEDMLVAYFSAEYGIHESVKLYSGGLGVLSGDHCKSASDLGIPFVAVGLLYRNGYFHQYLNSDGWQQEYYPYNEFYNMPLERAKTPEGEDVFVDVKIEDRTVRVSVWVMKVGTIRLVLLDSDVEGNSPHDRHVTGQLYGGDTSMRLRQEIILGVAGYRALRAMGEKPSVYHINEGHPSFLTLERIRQYVSEGIDLRTAAEVVRKSTLFTTHTPVPAGFDVFGTDQIQRYLGPLFEDAGFNLNQLMGFGRVNPFDESEGFAMAICGIKLSTYRNGVSKLHGDVSRKMFKNLWPNALTNSVPVGHVTNGIHLPTFISEDFKALYNRYLSENWYYKPYDFSVWENADTIPDAALFSAKQRQREKLIVFARKHLKKQILHRGGTSGELLKADEVLNPDCLTIGFARRFATYKRGYLLFMDEQRLHQILNNADRPVQIIIAGKAHPKDNGGKEIIKKIFHICRKPMFRDKIVFIEDYDIEVARYLAHGVDIWLNTPRRPMEASGTSGMKIAANGGLNLSILDGWWDEGYNGENGWAIGAGEQYDKESYQDHVESMELYDKLESEIIPMFYSRDKADVPREWTKMMKQAIKTCASFFNTSRMVMDYTDKYYARLHKLNRAFRANKYEEAKKFIEWKDTLLSGWDSLSFVDTAVDASEMKMGADVHFTAKVKTDKINSEHISVCALVEYDGESGEFVDPEFVELELDSQEGDLYSFSTKDVIKKAGKMKVAFAALPKHEFLQERFELNQIKWA
ncbi:alpha-glucan family phosphorylase [Limisalsivibrio acetivorans]|uniref:alpha-glucan family phosphorylase n=1 Tax=Limisalsivibrio acetivorans TaxID=1304888 RepID=UPI0003B749F3|nr:alpha-glucan family phosphorylase [Limisalsivibrio acetivorans]